LEAADIRVEAVVTRSNWRHVVAIEPRQYASVELPVTPNTPTPLEIEVRGGQRGKPAVFVRVLSVADANGRR
jgi:hypothetical protein